MGGCVWTPDAYICPTHVGMNRASKRAGMSIQDICPTHVGMNRFSWLNPRSMRNICPTHVGMNRLPRRPILRRHPSAPRMWG